MKYKFLYLHGRPSAHPIHAALAESVNSFFYPVDKYFNWQDKNKTIFYRLFSSLINALLYPIKKYDAILVDGIHFAPIISKKLGLIPKNKKILVHLGSHTLFFMYTNKFNPLVKKLHLWALKNYDGLLCEGEMAQELCIKMLGNKIPNSYITFLGPKMERCNSLSIVKPLLESKRIITICNGPGEFRMWYKGMDIMIEAVGNAIIEDDSIKFHIYGIWDTTIIKQMLFKIPENIHKNIVFEGHCENIHEELAKSALYIHISRGDAFPTSTIEAAHSGLPTLISEYTGTKEIFSKVDSNLITTLDVIDVTKKIQWYLNLSILQKSNLSNQIRDAVKSYTEEDAINHYIKTIDEIVK